jgi:hypothetical protein
MEVSRLISTAKLAVTAIVVFSVCRSAVSQVVRTPYQGVSNLVMDHGAARQWTTGDRILHIRSWQTIWFDDADDPRLRGNFTVTANLDFHLAPLPTFGYGPMWGTVRLANEGGSREGTFVGERTTLGHSHFRLVMKGAGGYRGLHAVADYARMTPHPGAPLSVCRVDHAIAERAYAGSRIGTGLP